MLRSGYQRLVACAAVASIIALHNIALGRDLTAGTPGIVSLGTDPSQWEGVKQGDGEMVINSACASLKPGSDNGDWSTFYALQFDVRALDGRPTTLRISVGKDPKEALTAVASIRGDGWQTVTLPWNAFTQPVQWYARLHEVSEIQIAAGDGAASQPASAGIALRDVRLVHAQSTWLTTPVKGKSVPAGKSAQYAVRVTNCKSSPQSVNLAFEKSVCAAMIIALRDLPVKYDNVKQPPAAGRDYGGGPVKIAGQPYNDAIPGEPKDRNHDAVVTIDLTDVGAARLRGVVGGDFPVGDESQRHKIAAQRVVGTEARFLTVLEPFESNAVVVHAVAESENRVRVELSDGRVQTIDLAGLDSPDGKARVKISESNKAGKLLRGESTEAGDEKH